MVGMPIQRARISGASWSLYLQFRRDPLDFLLSSAASGDLIQLPSVTGVPTFIVHHPEVVRAALATHESSVVKGKSGRILGYTLGSGLLTSEGPLHLAQRRYLQPAFHAKVIADGTEKMAHLAVRHVESWLDGQPRNLSEALLDLTLDIVFETLFGVSVGEHRQSLHELIEETIVYSTKQLLSAITLPRFVPTPSVRRHVRAVHRLRSIAATVLVEAKRKLETAGGVPENALQFMVCARDEDGQPLSDSELIDHISTFIIGGHETTANLLSWVVYLLDQHPAVQRVARAEVDALGAAADVATWTADGRQTPFLRQVLRETLRLYPPAWTILRETTEPLEVEGILLPAKASLILSPYCLHRNPKYFDHPEAFLPERFAGTEEPPWPKFAYIPFGAGGRTCIGNTYAQLEASIVLGVLLQKAEWAVQRPEDVVADPSVSLRVRRGLHAVLYPRSREERV